jgi:hypothetical protein
MSNELRALFDISVEEMKCGLSFLSGEAKARRILAGERRLRARQGPNN